MGYNITHKTSKFKAFLFLERGSAVFFMRRNMLANTDKQQTTVLLIPTQKPLVSGRKIPR